MSGPDSDFSIEPDSLTDLRIKTRDCWDAFTDYDFILLKLESKNTIFRRSLYFVKRFNIGETFTKEHIM